MRSPRNHRAELRLGLEPGITPEIFRQALADADVERCLCRLTVQQGDAFFVPAGTRPHHRSRHALMRSAAAFRYHLPGLRLPAAAGGRLIPLPCTSIELWMCWSSERSDAEKRGAVQIQQGPLQKTYLAACPYFATEIWEFSASVDATTSPDRFELLVLLDGQGRIRWGSESMPFARGEAWLLPAALGAYQMIAQSPTKLLRTYVPDLQQLSRELAGSGLSESQRSAVLRQ